MGRWGGRRTEERVGYRGGKRDHVGRDIMRRKGDT